jgi:Rrf2 family protein
MKVSAQEEYGLRCLLQIAKTPDDELLTIPEIAEREGLSQTHVAKLLMVLRKDGLILSTRGQAGGYMLARKPEKIPVREVLHALGGPLYDGEFCERHSGHRRVCSHNVECNVRSLWQRLQNAVDEALEGVTVADLINESQPIRFAELDSRLPVLRS